MATTSVGPIALQQINQDFYVGRGFLHTMQKAVTFAVSTGSGTVIIPTEYTGTDQISAVTGGSQYVYILDRRNGQQQTYSWNGTAYVPTPFEPLGGIVAETITAQTVNADNADFTNALVDNSPVRTFANSPDAPGGMIWPTAGIAVSTGEDWVNPSINPTTIPSLNTSTTFTQLLATTGNLDCLANNGSFPLVTPSTGGLRIGWNVSQGAGEVDFVCSTGGGPAGGGFAWYVAYPGATISPGTPTSMDLDSGNILHLANSVRIGPRGTGEVWSSGSPNINADTSSLSLNAGPGGAVFIGYDQGGAGIIFGNGAGQSAATITVNGDGNFNGTLTAATKNFRIPHPLDASKDLVHSCIEGPECAVFYRGEGKTTNGIAEITLPDYFEALTLKDQRTVQVTPLIEEDNASFGACAATRVSNGKFRVCSTTNSQGFYWEVKAIRADIPPLEVVSDRESATATTEQQTSDKNKSRK